MIFRTTIVKIELTLKRCYFYLLANFKQGPENCMSLVLN